MLKLLSIFTPFPTNVLIIEEPGNYFAKLQVID